MDTNDVYPLWPPAKKNPQNSQTEKEVPDVEHLHRKTILLPPKSSPLVLKLTYSKEEFHFSPSSPKVCTAPELTMVKKSQMGNSLRESLHQIFTMLYYLNYRKNHLPGKTSFYLILCQEKKTKNKLTNNKKGETKLNEKLTKKKKAKKDNKET